MRGNLIHDGDDYVLSQCFRLVLLYPFIVVLKATEIAHQATFREKAFFIAAVGELTKLGRRPGSDEFERLCEYFFQAAFVRGFVTHQVFFGQTPREAAELFV